MILKLQKDQMAGGEGTPSWWSGPFMFTSIQNLLQPRKSLN